MYKRTKNRNHVCKLNKKYVNPDPKIQIPRNSFNWDEQVNNRVILFWKICLSSSFECLFYFCNIYFLLSFLLTLDVIYVATRHGNECNKYGVIPPF